MKTQALFLSIMIIVVLSLSFSASAQNTSNTTSTPTPTPTTTPPLCTDSDGGQNYNTQGTVYYTELGSSTPLKYAGLSPFTDSCISYPASQPSGVIGDCAPGNGCSILEGFCQNNQFYISAPICLNGCKYGACVNSTNMIATPTPTPSPVCSYSVYTAGNCKTESDCKATGAYWYEINRTCEYYQPYSCAPTQVGYCNTETTCKSNYGNWCKGTGGDYCLKSSCQPCSSSAPWSCFNETACKGISGLWCQKSDGTYYCGSGLTNCPTIASTPNLNNASATPIPQITPIPYSNLSQQQSPTAIQSAVYTGQPSPTSQYKTSSSCQTDQDCSWLITNGCPEIAGASWSCSSLTIQASKSKSDICPRVLSERPPINCGCIQNNCAVYEKEKPKEPPKKIGNTEVDSAALLGIVIQMEQLKVKFEFLRSAAEKLSAYYTSTGNKDSAVKWSTASSLLQAGIDKIEFLKPEIKSKLSTFGIEDIRSLKKEIKMVIGTIGDVLKSVL